MVDFVADNEMIGLRRKKLEELIQEGKDPHTITKFDVNAFSTEIKDSFDSFEGKSVSLAGRIMAKRGHGKIFFFDLQDSKGMIQILAKKNAMDEKDFPYVQKLDIGDIVGCSGKVMRTNAGEVSVEASSITLLTKSIQILPEKYHGLTDTDLRYRQRYVDLIMSPEIKDIFRKRTRILSSIREFLNSRDFLEVETPILNTIAGGANARPFITHHNALDIDMYLRIANELYLKRLIVGGFDRVYEMGRMFRNEGMDATHNPEYTMIEMYQAYTDYEGMMELTESLVASVCEKVNGSHLVHFQGQEIDFKPPWRRITMTEAVKEYAGIDFSEVFTDEEAQKLAKEHKIEVEKHAGRGKVLQEFFDFYVEDKLIQPTFVYEYPKEISPLAKSCPENPQMTERFEAFVCGWEIANAYSELNDAKDQKERFEHQVNLRKQGDEEATMMDYDFINALEVGLPPTGGLGIGIDRLVMLLTDQSTIRDVLFFPTMKPTGLELESKKEAMQTMSVSIDFSKVVVEGLSEEKVDFETFSKSDFRAVKVLDCEEVEKSNKLLKFTLDDGSDQERTILSGIKKHYTPEDLIGKTLLAIVNLPPRKMMGIDSEGMLLSAIHEQEGEEKLQLIMLDHMIPAGAKLY